VITLACADSLPDITLGSCSTEKASEPLSKSGIKVGYLPLDRADANIVFQLVSRRYEKGSIIITSNKAFSEWGQVFTDEVLATAILDRFLHHCDVISINGPSWRLKDRLTSPDPPPTPPSMTE
jgi:hypothetical protein